MRHIVLLLILGIGGYFAWQSASQLARDFVTGFLRKHLIKVLLIVGLVIVFFAFQAAFGSIKFF